MTAYRAVCHDCGWESDGPKWRDHYRDASDAERAVNGHVGHGCDPEKTEVVSTR